MKAVKLPAGQRRRPDDPPQVAQRQAGKRSLVESRYGAGETQAPRTSGPGVTALEDLLARGTPSPRAVVKILDAHRSERQALLDLVKARLGDDFLAQVIAATDHLRLDLERRELVAGDPGDPDGGYFVASQDQKGARWRTSGGGFDGTVNDKGLDSHIRTGDHDAIHVGVDAKKKEGVVGYQHDGKTMVEGFGRFSAQDDSAMGVRVPRDLGHDASLTGEVRHVRRKSGTSDELAAQYRDLSTTGSGYVGRDEGSGRLIGGIEGSHTFDPHTKLSGAATVEPGGWNASVSGSHQFDGGSKLSGNVYDGSAGHGGSLSGSYKASEQETLSGTLSHSAKPGGVDAVTSLSLSERYRSPDLVHGMDLSATTGQHDQLRGVGSVEGRLGHNLYGGAFGSFTAERSQHPEASIGASLTFTPHEKAALTLAGILDQDGYLETRLQLDIFQKKIDNVETLSDQKKKALVSLFVSYSTGAPGMLNDRFGAPEYQRQDQVGGNTVMAGIRIRF